MLYLILSGSLFLILATLGKSTEVEPTNKTGTQEQTQNFLVYVKEPVPQQESKPSEEHVEEDVFYEEIPIKIPILIPVKVPYPIKVPLPVPIPVKYPYIIHKKVEVPIKRQVPYTIEKPYPVKVIKKVPYDVPEPYPVKVPVHKTRHIYYELEYPKRHAERRSDNVLSSVYGLPISRIY